MLNKKLRIIVYTAGFIAAFAAAVFASGCVSSELQSSDVSYASDISVISEASEASEMSNVSEETSEGPSIVMPAVAGYEGMYDYSSLLRESFVADSIEIFENGTVLVCGRVENEFVLTIIDRYGSYSREIAVSENAITYDITGNAMLLTSGSVYIWYPDILNRDESYSVSVKMFSEIAACTEEGLCYVHKNGQLVFMNLKTGKSTNRVQLPSGEGISYGDIAVESSGNYVYIDKYYITGDDYNSSEVIVDTVNKTYRDVYTDDVCSILNGFNGNAVKRFYKRWDLYGIDDGTETEIVKLKSHNESEVNITENHLITEQRQDGYSYVRLYDFSSGECKSALKLSDPDSYHIASSAVTNDGDSLYVCVIESIDTESKIIKYFKKINNTIMKAMLTDYPPHDTQDNIIEKTHLYLCMTEGKHDDEGLTDPEIPKPEIDYDSLDEYEKKAYDVGQKYGLTILIGEKAAKDTGSYSHQVVSGGKVLDDALKAVENVLSKYPEGFFTELQNGMQRNLIIKLVGDIYNVGTTDNSGVGGYFMEMADVYASTVTVDCSWDYFTEECLAHELMHAADSYIEYYNFAENNLGYSEWDKYMPEGFKYNDSYKNNDGDNYYDTEYTFYEMETEAYFIDSYCKTFAIEDRARCFEYAFVHGTGFINDREFPEYFTSDVIRAKTVYIFETYREVFETVRNADEVYWERGFITEAE